VRRITIQEEIMQDTSPTTDAATRQKYYDTIEPQSLAPLWEVLKGLVPPEPKSKADAHVWKYSQVRPLLMEAGKIVTAEEAERRVLVLENPALKGQSRITPSMYSGVQLVMPGEIAPAHKHTASALRFVLESDGGYTTVAGERTYMRRGDFVITPNGAWHDHGQEKSSPIIWVDGLDLHMINFFETGFMEHHNDKSQTITKQEGYSVSRYGSGLAPLEADSPFGQTTPIFNYTYERSSAALMEMVEAGSPNPHAAYALRYVNPLDGGWAMPTIATWLTHIPKGFETKASRATDGRTIIVVEGEITAEIDGKTFMMGESDIGVIPSWAWQTVRADKDAVVFTFSDRSAQEKLGIWREEKR
jgi:gentisate 1,2-dioxygenase